MISIDRSLIQIRKKRGPKIDPCGTPALTGNHSDVWPFKTTLWDPRTVMDSLLLITLTHSCEKQKNLKVKKPKIHFISAQTVLLYKAWCNKIG